MSLQQVPEQAIGVRDVWIIDRLQARYRALARHPLLTGGAWTFLGQVGAQSAALVANTLVGRVLGPANFGLYSLAQNMSSTAATVAGYAPALVATRGAAVARASRGRARAAVIDALRTTFAVGFAATILLVVFSPTYAQLVGRSTDGANVLEVASLLTLPLVWFAASGGLLAGLGSFRLFALGRLTSAPISAGLTVAGAVVFGLRGAIIGLVAGTCVIATVAHIQLRKAVKSVPLASREPSVAQSVPTKTILLPAALSSIASAPVIWICQTMLAAHGGLASVAVIGAGIVWGQALLLVPTSLNQALLAELSCAVAEDMHAARRVYLLGWAIAASAIVPLLVALLVATPIVLRFYGFDDPGAAHAFRLVVSAYAIQGVTGATVKVLESTGRLWLQLGCNLIWATGFIGLVAAWRGSGALGFGYAAVAAFVVHSLLVHAIALRVVRVEA